MVTTDEMNTVNFTIHSISGSTIVSGSVAPGSLTTITNLLSYTVSSGTERNKGLLLTTNSNRRVSVAIGMSITGFSAGAYQSRPVWGYPVDRYVYYAVSVSRDGQQEGAFGTLLLVGANEGTNITITPTVTLIIPSDISPSGNQTQLAPNNTVTFVLNYLQTLLITPIDSVSDLTGTRVESDKPIAVYSGHSDGYIPVNTFASDFVGDQLQPVASWGTTFITSPFSRRPSGYILKLISSQPNTGINIKCNDDTSFTLMIATSGGFINQSISQTSCYITSNAPIQVAQFSLAQLLDSLAQEQRGDPEMMIVPPTHHYTNNITFPVFTLESSLTYMNLAVINPCTTMSNISEAVKINGNPLQQNWTSTNNDSYALPEHSLTAGVYSVWTVNPKDRIFAMIYGLNTFISYIYTGGMNMLPSGSGDVQCILPSPSPSPSLTPLSSTPLVTPTPTPLGKTIDYHFKINIL